MILDNCNGHEHLQELENVEYGFLPANTTALYQPMDQGLIAQTKIRYRSMLLRQTIDILLRLQDPKNGFKASTGNGRYGLREGQLPHVDDAMALLDQTWEAVSKDDIINCWPKSQCLPSEHVDIVKQISFEHGDRRHAAPTAHEAVNADEANQLFSGHALLNLSLLPDTRLVDLVNDVSGFETAGGNAPYSYNSSTGRRKAARYHK